MKKFLRNVMKFLINIFICNFLYKVKFINKENEEKLDKCIICPNHSNTLEPTWIYAKTDNLSIMAKAELFKNKFIASIYEYFGVFAIHRGQRDVKSVLYSINLFRNKDEQKLLIFPEGERIRKDREKGTPKEGPAFIAYKANVPIVPVYITKNAKLFSKVNVIYGEPIYITKDIVDDKEKLKNFSTELIDIIYNLKK